MKNFDHITSHLAMNVLDLPTEYHDGKRFYVTPEGERYKSITSILSDLTKADIQKWRERVGETKANKITRQASSRGTRLHSLCESYIQNQEGCLDGNCGACTVNMNGRIVDSCLVLAAEIDGGEVETVEGMASSDGLHPLQKAFLEEAALQCGICTPGFLVAAKGLLDNEPKPSEHRIRHWLAGNLCRCTGYDKIVKAVQKAATNN